jgi:glycosyltransferase involved in cell wall biosynthesis
VTIHGVEHKLAPSAYPGRTGAAVDDFVQDTLSRAARVISPSETTRSDLVHLYGADPARITVIPHGTSIHLRPRSQEEVASAVEALAITSPYLLTVGAHHPRKNIPFLIQVFAQAFPAGSGGPTLVVTNAVGTTAAELGEIAQRVGAAGRVRLLAHVGGEQLAALYTGAMAACVPSLYEGFGLPALESMACGTPVIGSDVGGVREVASGAALLVELGSESEWVEGLRRLALEAPLRAHLSRLGLQRAARYSWADSVAQHAALLAAELALARSGQRR